MDQFEIEHFNRATTVTVDDKVRIKNLISNSHLATAVIGETEVTLTFKTVRKGKPEIMMNYVIRRERLTDADLLKLAPKA